MESSHPIAQSVNDSVAQASNQSNCSLTIQSTNQLTPQSSSESTTQCNDQLIPISTPLATEQLIPQSSPKSTFQPTDLLNPQSNPKSTFQSTDLLTPQLILDPILQSTSHLNPQSVLKSTPELTDKLVVKTNPESTVKLTPQSTPLTTVESTGPESTGQQFPKSTGPSTSHSNLQLNSQPSSSSTSNVTTQSTSKIPNQPVPKPILKKVPKSPPKSIKPELVCELLTEKNSDGANLEAPTKKLVKRRVKCKVKLTVKAVNGEASGTIVEKDDKSELTSIQKSDTGQSTPKANLKTKKANATLKSTSKATNGTAIKSDNVEKNVKSIPKKTGKSTEKTLVKSTKKPVVKSTATKLKTAESSNLSEEVVKVSNGRSDASKKKPKSGSKERKEEEVEEEKEKEEEEEEDSEESDDEESDDEESDDEEEEEDEDDEEEDDSDDDIFIVELIPGSILIRKKTVKTKGKAKSKLKARSAESRERSSGSPLRHLNDTSLGVGGLDEVTTTEVSRCRVTPPATSLPRFRKYSIQDFQFLKVLGKGSFGKVLLAELSGTECYYAVKCLKKDVVLEDDDVECTLIERKVLALGTNHPYLCHLFCTFQTESHLFFVMEYLNGGDLMFHIQQSGRFDEGRARFYASEIVSGLMFLHKKGIVYRDLKLDNILLDFDGHVRIADFGMCKLQIYLDRTADTFCGTPDYMAPEIIKGLAYNQCVDWWSFGILLYEMLVGQSPFSGCDEDDLFWSICNEQPHYPRFLSKESKLILSQLLEKDSSRRLGSSELSGREVTSHVFFRDWDWFRLERRLLDPPFKPRRHPLDVQYFDKAFTNERPRLTPIDKSILQSMDQTQFQGFSYTNPNVTK